MIPTEVQKGPRSLAGERRISTGLRTLEATIRSIIFKVRVVMVEKVVPEM
jgi:hypothetical protein